MMKYFKMILLFCVLFISGCTSIEVKDYQPKKLANIPDSAFWKGGVDGGNWFLIKPVSSENLVAISVYNDNDGSLTKTITFALICKEDKPAQTGDLAKQINCFDGEIIHFINNSDADCSLLKTQ